MTEREERARQRIASIFREEATERIATLAAAMAQIEREAGAAPAKLIEDMFREAHSLKAAARTVDEAEIEQICQSMESVFAAVKRNEASLTPSMSGALTDAVDALEDFVASIGAGPSERRLARAVVVASALQEALAAGAQPERTVPVELPTPATALAVETPAEPMAAPIAAMETVRLSVQRLNALLLLAESMLADKLATAQLAGELKDGAAGLAEWKTEWDNAAVAAAHFRRVSAERGTPDPLLSAAQPLLKFLDGMGQRIATLVAATGAAQTLAATEAHGLGVKVDQLLFAMKQILMLPCGTILQPFIRAVRDLGRDQDKDLELTLDGAELEIDRRILQELKDPLLHLVRNCVDHGIERPDARAASGKPPHASIRLSVTMLDGDKVEFRVADDGAGIATAKLAATAVKLGLLPPERAAGASEAELLPLIFQSGVSTSPLITDLSGRGLGLAIVREKVERLGGSVAVETRAGQGTIFRLTLPRTLAIYRGIAVRVADHVLVVPTFSAERVVRVVPSSVTTVERRPVIDLDGATIPLVSLRDALRLPAAAAAERRWIVAIVLGSGTQRVAFAADGIEGDQEILMKPLGKCLARVRNVQGAAILSSGRVAPILNVADLLKSAAKIDHAAPQPEIRRDLGAARPKSILVAEDSITARGLLRGILEAAGYRIKTAVDGMEAWSMLKLEPFDLLVSDVEMPRMNGFELTTRIRGDISLGELPVVLVTALESREHIERGVEVGANAYILKGGFEQGRLLDAVKRLA